MRESTFKSDEPNDLSFLGKWALYAGPVLTMAARYIAMWAAAKLPDWAPTELKSEAFWFGLIVAVLLLIVGAVLTARRKHLEREVRLAKAAPGRLGGTLTCLLGFVAVTGLCGCGTVGVKPLHGANGLDGAMLCGSVGQPVLPWRMRDYQDCGPEAVPVADPADPPGTMLGRGMVRAADWTAEHPGWASFIAGAAIFIGIAEKENWWGAFDGDDDDPVPPAPASDKELATTVRGSGNSVRTEYEYVPGGGPMPNVETVVEGDNNTVVNEIKPPAEG